MAPVATASCVVDNGCLAAIAPVNDASPASTMSCAASLSANQPAPTVSAIVFSPGEKSTCSPSFDDAATTSRNSRPPPSIRPKPTSHWAVWVMPEIA